jgi:hypothetical protein
LSGRLAASLAAVLVLALASCSGLTSGLRGRPGPETGLLRGRAPSAARGAHHPDRLTDGIGAEPGDPPRTDLTTVLVSPEAFVVYDLGAVTPVRCALVEADGDDRYTLSLSNDGARWEPLWTAAPADERGMQLRLGRDLAGSGRYLRLAAAGGDGVYAVAEVAAFAACPARFPPGLAVQKGTPVGQAVETKIAALAALAAAYVLAYRRRAPDFVKLLVALPLGVALSLAVQLVEIWPPPARLALELAGVAAVVAAAFLARAALGRRPRRNSKPAA